MSEPVVSVLMAVHNGRPYLGEAVESILTQSFPSFEFIIVDDGSTDGSIVEIDWYAKQDSRIRVLSQSNKGLAAALNVGLSMARGKYTARMDADDVAYPERLSKQVARMAKQPNLVLLGGSFDYIDSNGGVLKQKVVTTDAVSLRRGLTEDRNQFCHPCAMVGREAVCNVGGYRTLVGKYAQDYDLWLRLSEVGSIANLAQSILGYRVHEGQVSVRNIVAQRHAAEVYKVLARQRRSNGCEDLRAAIMDVAKMRRKMMADVAGDCLNWSSLFYRMGNSYRARRMFIRAVLTSPFCPRVRNTMGRLSRGFLVK